MTTHQALLNAHGMKATSQRLCILKQLERLGHATLEDIYEGAKPLYPTLSLTTVYRNLGEMMGKGLVDEVQIPRQKQRYEIVKGPHIHLSCQRCGALEDCFLDTSTFIQSVEQKTGADVQENSIVLGVICSDCLEKERA